jgi:DNA-binding GntR family transcriptional regulator
MLNKKKHIKPPPLSEIAYQKIKEFIVTLKLVPGTQIDEAEMAGHLSIGRTPIREALFRLNAENLVEVSQGRGFYVPEITLGNLRDLFETMLILERSAVALAARRIKPNQIKNLQRINGEIKKAWLGKKLLQVTLQNSRFHRTIYQATENAYLISYLDNLQYQSQRLAYMCFSKETSTYDLESHAQVSIRDHQSLIDSFSQGQDLAAVKIITEHVKLFQRRVNHFMLPSLDTIDSVTQLESLSQDN